MQLIVKKFLPKTVQSQNEFTGGKSLKRLVQGKARYINPKYERYRKDWHKIVGLTVGESPKRATEKRYVVIINCRDTGRKFDLGNLTGGSKPIPDALKQRGWLFDDTEKWVKIDYLQQKASGPNEEGVWLYIYSYGKDEDEGEGEGKDLIEKCARFQSPEDMLVSMPEGRAVIILDGKIHFVDSSVAKSVLTRQ